MNNDEKKHKVRKVRKTNWIYETFHLPDPITGKMLKCDASIEHDFVLTKLFDPNVLVIETSPTSYYSEAIERRYTRDIVILDETMIPLNIECKSRQDSEKPKNITKFELLENEIKNHGARFEVVTDEDIRKGYTITNLKCFHIYRSMPKPPKEIIKTIVTTVYNNIRITFGELRLQMRDIGINVKNIWYCLAHKIIQTNLEKLITNESILWVNSDEI